MSSVFQVKKIEKDKITLVPAIDNMIPVIVGQKLMHRGREWGIVKEVLEFSAGVEAVVRLEKSPGFIDLGDVVQISNNN